MNAEVGNRGTGQGRWRRFRVGGGGVLIAAFLASGTAGAQTAGVPAEQQNRIEAAKAKGVEASLTILPVGLGERAGPARGATAGDMRARITEVVGLLLEMKGLKNLELGPTGFDPAAKSDMTDRAASLAEFLKQHPVATDYVLYAEMRTDGVNAIVADKAGALVWSDEVTAQDKLFNSPQPPEPMAVCSVLVEHLSPLFGLTQATRRAAKPGRMAALMAERSGSPPASETEPMRERQAELKKAMPNATLAVFAPRIRAAAGTVEAGSAAELAKLITDAGLGKAEPAKQSPLLETSQADPNEMKVMWDLAREFRDYVKKNPPDADYVLYADYAFNPQKWEQGFVHLVVCDRKGDWVLAELRNSHHAEYQSLKPTSRESCDKLLLKLLRSCLK